MIEKIKSNKSEVKVSKSVAKLWPFKVLHEFSLILSLTMNGAGAYLKPRRRLLAKFLTSVADPIFHEREVGKTGGRSSQLHIRVWQQILTNFFLFPFSSSQCPPVPPKIVTQHSWWTYIKLLKFVVRLKREVGRTVLPSSCLPNFTLVSLLIPESQCNQETFLYMFRLKESQTPTHPQWNGVGKLFYACNVQPTLWS